MAFPMLLLPNLYYFYDWCKLKTLFKNEVRQAWLMENGNQLVLRTFDGVLHKVSIIENREHEIVQTKTSLIFVMKNSGREYLISCKDAKMLDYDLIDRIVRAICVDTNRTTQVFHHLIHKQ